MIDISLTSTPNELGKVILKDFYNKLEANLMLELSIERKIRETTLAQTMIDLRKTHVCLFP